MTPQVEGSQFESKHLEQTISNYLHIIETGQAKPSQHYLMEMRSMVKNPLKASGVCLSSEVSHSYLSIQLIKYIAELS